MTKEAMAFAVDKILDVCSAAGCFVILPSPCRFQATDRQRMGRLHTVSHNTFLLDTMDYIVLHPARARRDVFRTGLGWMISAPPTLHTSSSERAASRVK